MQQILPAVIIILAAVSVWMLLIVYLMRSSRRILKNYRLLVKKYGFTLDESNKSGLSVYPAAFGVYGGKAAEIGSEPRDLGTRKIPYTYIKVLCENPGDISFRIIRNSKLNEIAFERVLTGDAEFDRNFILVSGSADTLKKIPGYTSCLKLVQAAKLGPLGEMTLDKDTILYSEPGLISNANRLMRAELILHAMLDIADDINLSG